MTNVVGILVILLTVTQLGVGDAVKRISSGDQVDPEALAEAKQELLKLELVKNELIQRLKSLVYEKGVDIAAELQRIKRELADAKANVAALADNRAERVQAAELDARRLLEEAQRVLEEQKKKEDELTAKITAGNTEIARLRAQLEDTPIEGPPPPKVVHLPNPRPAPEGAKPVTVLCREGRVLHIDAENLQERAQKLANFIVSRKKLDRDPAAGIDGKILAEEFNRTSTIRDRDFDVTLEVRGRTPMLVLKRREGAGETLEQLQRSGSQYQRDIGRLPPDKFYLQFLVWPDSFETYLQARKIASDRGLPAGWNATTMQGEYAIPLGGDIRCGPPPKPQPKPATPSPAPAQPPKKPPVDVVD
jgi:hypothetical protein